MYMRTKHFFAFIVIFSSLNACKKFDDFQTDPNRTTQATPDLLLSTVQQQAFNQIELDAALASRQLVNTESVSPFQYYNWLRRDFGRYNNLRQVSKMQTEAVRLNKSSYLPLAIFFKCWNLYELTMIFGDIPYSEAAQGDEAVFSPSYDSQQLVFKQLLEDLDQANSMISNSMESVSGDLIYGGDMWRWKKAINTFTLRVLLTLSDKTNDPSLQVRERFAKIIADPTNYPVLESNLDNLALPYYDIVNNRYPYFNNNGIQTANYMEKTFVDLLKASEDPRLFRYAAPARSLVGTYGANDVRSYNGVLGSAPNNENAAAVVTGRISNINSRYYNNPVNEAALGLGFAEQQFILAEGVLRGWIPGDALTYYRTGIRASMEDRQVPEVAINAYLAKNDQQQLPAIEPLRAVITQKYIASFMLPGWNAFFEHRRTGFPTFDVSGGAVLNNGLVPKRWMYPQDELTNNTTHVSEAIARQYPDGDHINGEMWLIK